MENNIQLRGRLVAAAIITLFFSFALLGGLAERGGGASAKTLPPVLPKESIDPFKNLELSAKGVYVIDLNTDKPLFALNPDKPYALASVTKLMAVLAAEELVPEYTVIELTPEHLSAEGDAGLLSGERWKRKDLSDLTLVTSSNDGVSAIAAVSGAVAAGTEDPLRGKAFFVHAMNEIAKRIGLTSTSFKNESGLDLPEGPGAVGSAKDMARLLAYIMKEKPELLEATRYKTFEVSSLNPIRHVVSNTNEYTEFFPGMLASKTGYTDLAGGNLVIAFDPYIGRPIVVAVLGSTYEGRFEDVKKLADASMAYIRQTE